MFADTDQNYTNGLKFAWISPDVDEYRESGKLPDWADDAVARLPVINRRPVGYKRNIVLTLGQSIFTPQDILRRDLIRDDRPYAGWLYVGAAFRNKTDEKLDTIEVQLGVVGPLAFAEQSQTLVHEVRGLGKPNGWRHQLDNELGLEFIYERKWRSFLFGTRSQGFGMDVIGHAGVALGNVQTYGNAGLELRLGWNVPDDFGTSLIRPGSETSAPSAKEDLARRAFGVHLFAVTDGRAVARDIFLDGNTFTDSHSVDRQPVVGDFAAGVSVVYRGLKLTFAKAIRTREFKGQARDHNFGALSFSYTF